MAKKQPNVLLFLVDELRYPTVYDSLELREWMTKNLRAQKALRESGIDFKRHYVQSTAARRAARRSSPASTRRCTA